MKTAMEKLDMLVVTPPSDCICCFYDRTDGVYCRPVMQFFKTRVAQTASNRSLQWREIKRWNRFNRSTIRLWQMFAEKLAFTRRLSVTLRIDEGAEPNIEDITREFNRGMWTIGWQARAERLKLHMAKSIHISDRTPLCARVGGPRFRMADLHGPSLAVLLNS
jgi:formate dehydrogenase major subunit